MYPQEVTVPHFVGGGRIEMTVKAVPEPGPGQLLVRVEANALCGSERGQFLRGSAAVTPGHEAAGTVVVAGPETQTPVGTRGAIFLMDFCGECRSCRLGFTNQCRQKRADMGFNRDGGYGVYELVSERIFFPVPSTLSATAATLLLDIMGTGGHALGRAALVRLDIESLLIAGAGPIGLGVLAMAKVLYGRGFPVHIFDVNDYRLELAASLGGTAVSIAEGRTLPDDLKADIAIDTSGKKVARQTCLSALGQRGVLVLVGHGETLEMNVSGEMIAPERAVLGSEYFAFAELADNLKLLQENRDYLNRIITHRFPVTEIQPAFELFFAGNTGKVIIEQ